MKKTYIIPFVTLENIEQESPLMGFSKIDTGAIGEGDGVTNGGQLTGGGNQPPENSEGEGLNVKGGFFDFSDIFGSDDEE